MDKNFVSINKKDYFFMIQFVSIGLLSAVQPVQDNVQNAELQPKDCVQDERLLKKIQKTKLKKAIKRTSTNKIYNGSKEIVGYSADSETMYMRKFLALYTPFGYYYYPKVYIDSDGMKKYYLGVSKFSPVKTSSVIGSLIAPSKFKSVDAPEVGFDTIEVPTEKLAVRFKSSISDQHEHCGIGGTLKSDILVQGCLFHSSKEFEVDKDTYDFIAESDPKTPFLVKAVVAEDKYASCPLYFSPLTFLAADAKLNELVDQHD